MKKYPRWMYHRTLPATIVNDRDAELACLESGWADTPAAFEDDAPPPPPPPPPRPPASKK